MSDETKIEDEDTEDVEGHGGKLSSSPVRFGNDAEGDDVEGHGRVVSQVRNADEADDDVQAHAHRLTS
jgi:hypothetical protein